MSQAEDDMEIVGNGDDTSDEWVKEGSSVGTISKDASPVNADIPNPNLKRDKSSDQVIPRHERWLNLLGVRNKPDLLTDWDHLYNLKDQATLRKDCRVLVDQLERSSLKPSSSVSTVPQLESLITLYCKKRNVTYDRNCGWLDIIGKLIVLPFEQSTLFNVFYAITTKYIPRSSKMFDLFRLLLQYHDPELCSYLDSVKVQPEFYVSDLFHSLLAKGTTNQLCFVFWDHYFERGDPFLIFFVALVFTKYAREQILCMKNKEEISALLQNSPVQMNAEDVDDLLDICNVFLDNTPISVREDFHCLLFGSNLIDEISDFPLNSLMCLPISVQDLYKRVIDNNTSATTACFSYFVIDTRTQKAFNAGSVPGSYNLNGALIVDEPEKFTIAMSSLMKFKEDSCKKDHICFIGSGLEEDDSRMMMVISRFLHQNTEHISYVDGGYKALHSLLSDTNNLSKLSNHFNLHDFKCIECIGGGADKHGESKGWSLMEKMKKVMDGQKSLMKSKILASPPITSQEEAAVKHVNSTDRFGKRYRNIQSVFSISNEDSQDSDDNLNLSEIESSTAVSEKLKWSDVVKKPEIINHFRGHEVFPDKTQVPCYVALSRTYLHIFHEVPKEPGFVLSSLRHSLSSIMRVTSKKKIPEFLTFKFGYELPTGDAHVNKVHCFILPKAGDCAKAIKTGIIALKPSLIEKNDD